MGRVGETVPATFSQIQPAQISTDLPTPLQVRSAVAAVVPSSAPSSTAAPASNGGSGSTVEAADAQPTTNRSGTSAPSAAVAGSTYRQRVRLTSGPAAAVAAMTAHAEHQTSTTRCAGHESLPHSGTPAL